MANKPVLALDFDGVVHRYSAGWQGGDIYDPPTEGFFEWLIEAQEHFLVIIHSSRSKDPQGIAAMSAWLADHAAIWRAQTQRPLHLNVSFASKKPAAFVTIDDRALTFNGDWRMFKPKDLLRFKPWNQTGLYATKNEATPETERDPMQKHAPMGLAMMPGATGDCCVNCGNFTMRRQGPCLLCMTCGQTTGCS